MSEELEEMAPRQYAIIRCDWRWELILVESVTSKQFRGVEDPSRCFIRERTIPRRSCRYCGDEDTARRLYERLVSSGAQCEDERSKSTDRRLKRDADLIAAAKGGAL